MQTKKHDTGHLYVSFYISKVRQPHFSLSTNLNLFEYS